MKCKEGGRNILMSEMSEENLMELKNKVFKCSNEECGKEFEYENALKHLEECLKKEFCNYCRVEVYEREKEFHILRACPKSLFNCDNCEEVF